MLAEAHSHISGKIDRQVLKVYYTLLGMGSKLSNRWVRELCSGYEEIIGLAAEEYGRDRVSTTVLEHEFLNFQDMSGVYCKDFVERNEVIIQRLPARHLRVNCPIAIIYKTCNWRISRYFRRQGDLERAVSYRRECCRHPNDEWDCEQLRILRSLEAQLEQSQKPTRSSTNEKNLVDNHQLSTIPTDLRIPQVTDRLNSVHKHSRVIPPVDAAYRPPDPVAISASTLTQHPLAYIDFNQPLVLEDVELDHLDDSSFHSYIQQDTIWTEQWTNDHRSIGDVVFDEFITMDDEALIDFSQHALE
ncbi:hypothetical protein JX266_007292 [Neoarthrinium moseri]|uniref:uncharacterized protein n=1 Tax=Neoarthrinium moseri TaxID=1658444 RepID=UPI001FDD2BA8|nr:uncharacterized protein JN550_007847 [Neoarthrinium moseri]KAI1846719.1 hypothetical protein JX266_007292 [Neoarthrinium moseri]KAI1866158.1 hypothetical protein JN550_007847 [Neoarthrinium moseri]